VQTSARQPILNAPAPISWLVGLCVAVHALRHFLPLEYEARMLLELAFIPARYGSAAMWEADPVGAILSPFGYTFLHGGWLHLLVNMAMLLAFGSAVARRMSTSWFLVLYFAAGLAGALVVYAMSPDSVAPVLGASGAVSGMIGAVAMLGFWHHGHAPPPRPFNRRRTVWSFVIAWLLINLLFGFLPGEAFGVAGRIAWEAHLGGFVAGVVLMPLFDGRGRRARHD